MDRPCLNPNLDEDHPAPREPRRSLPEIMATPAHWIIYLLLAELTRRRGDRPPEPKTFGRLVHILVVRLCYVPVLVPLVVAACIYIGTHPPRWVSPQDPGTRGIYYDPVAFVTADEVRLEGWLIPVADERFIVTQRERALQAKRPAVVLVHDEGNNRSQMLPMVQPLRDSGFVVMVAGLRTSEASSIGATFGLREETDVRAAVEMLRRNPNVDPSRIAVVGSGTGANAAILAAEKDTKIAALVLDRPTRDIDRLILERVVPPRPWLWWMAPLCKWGFEIAYQVDVDDLNPDRFAAILASRPVLTLDETTGPSPSSNSDALDRIVVFLQRHLSDAAQAGVDKK